MTGLSASDPLVEPTASLLVPLLTCRTFHPAPSFSTPAIPGGRGLWRRPTGLDTSVFAGDYPLMPCHCRSLCCCQRSIPPLLVELCPQSLHFPLRSIFGKQCRCRIWDQKKNQRRLCETRKDINAFQQRSLMVGRRAYSLLPLSSFKESIVIFPCSLMVPCAYPP